MRYAFDVVSSINVSPVAHVDHPNDNLFVENFVDHPEITASGGEPACEFTMQRLTNP